jgi:hypothetical protein
MSDDNTNDTAGSTTGNAIRPANVGRTNGGGHPEIVAVGEDTRITPERASAMAHKRWNMYRQAAEDGIISASGGELARVAYSRMIGRQYALATDIERGRASTDAARLVSVALDALPDRRANQSPEQHNTLVIADSEIAERLLARLIGAAGVDEPDDEDVIDAY